MKSMANWLEEAFMETAFAEEREDGQFKGIADSLTTAIDDIFTAVAFAEEGERDTARSFMGDSGNNSGNHIGYGMTGFCAGRA